MRTQTGIAVAIVLFAACHTKAPTPKAEGCGSDSDCAVTTLGDDCCDHCEQVAATRKSIDALRAACKSSGPRRCPSLRCPQQPAVAKCVAGKCTATQR